MSHYAIIDKLDLQRMIGIPASVGVCEPIEGFVERPDFVLGCMKDMAKECDALHQKLEQAEMRCAELEDAVSTCAVAAKNGGWLDKALYDQLAPVLNGNGKTWLLRKQAEAVEIFAVGRPTPPSTSRRTGEGIMSKYDGALGTIIGLAVGLLIGLLLGMGA